MRTIEEQIKKKTRKPAAPSPPEARTVKQEGSVVSIKKMFLELISRILIIILKSK